MSSPEFSALSSTFVVKYPSLSYDAQDEKYLADRILDAHGAVGNNRHMLIRRDACATGGVQQSESPCFSFHLKKLGCPVNNTFEFQITSRWYGEFDDVGNLPQFLNIATAVVKGYMDDFISKRFQQRLRMRHLLVGDLVFVRHSIGLLEGIRGHSDRVEAYRMEGARVAAERMETEWPKPA